MIYKIYKSTVTLTKEQYMVLSSIAKLGVSVVRQDVEEAVKFHGELALRMSLYPTAYREVCALMAQLGTDFVNMEEEEEKKEGPGATS